MNTGSPRINLIVLRSADIDRLASFYKAMGLVFEKHRHGKGPEHYSSETNGFVFEIYPLAKREPTTSTRIGFSVDDVDSIVEMLTAEGGELVTAARDSEWGRRAVVKDPEGRTVELVTPPNPDTV